jgi:hypothetical protein
MAAFAGGSGDGVGGTGIVAEEVYREAIGVGGRRWSVVSCQ